MLTRPARLYLLHSALQTFGLAIWGLFFNLAVLAFGSDRAFLGWLGSAGIAAAAALSLPLWWLLGRIGLRNALVLQAVLYAASALVIALHPSPAALLAAVAVAAAGAVLAQLAAQPFMMRHSSAATRDRMFSFAAALAIGVAGLGSLAGGFLPGALGGALGVGPESALAYRATFGVAGAALALSVAPLLLVREGMVAADTETQRHEGEEPAARGEDIRGHMHLPVFPAPRLLRFAARLLPEPWPAIIRRPWPLLRLLVTPCLISWGAALLLPYLNLFFHERFGLSGGALGAIFAALGVATGLATLAAPLLSARLGAMPTVVLTEALSLPFLLALGFAPSLGLALGAALARAALFNMGAPLYDAYAMARVPEAVRPALSGLLGGASSVGYLLMPPLSVWVQARYGFAPLFLATAACYALATLLNYLLFVRRDERRR
jgi:MFS family permease